MKLQTFSSCIEIDVLGPTFTFQAAAALIIISAVIFVFLLQVKQAVKVDLVG